MKKNLNTSNVMNELRGQSVFFPQKPQEQPNEEMSSPPPSPSHLAEPLQTQERHLPQNNFLQVPDERASSYESKHASMLANKRIEETILKTLKAVGKEVLYVRLTQEEKNQVTDIEYTYQRQGIKTSGNEIGRIALNFLLADYKAHGEQSMLAKLLTALHT